MAKVKIGVSKENIERQRLVDAAKVVHLPGFSELIEPKMAQPAMVGEHASLSEMSDTAAVQPRMAAPGGWLERIQANEARLLQEQGEQ